MDNISSSTNSGFINCALENDTVHSNFTTEATLTIQYLYVVFGSVAFLANATICFVLLKNIKFFKKSAFIGGLALAETIFGAGHVVAGLFRIYYINTNSIYLLVHPLYCMNRVTIIFVLTIQLGSTMLLLIGGERLIATLLFDWYYKMWTNKKAWILTIAVYLVDIGITGICWLAVYYHSENQKISIECLATSVTGDIYSFYQGGLIVICGIWVSSTTMFSLVSFMKKRLSTIDSTNLKLKKFIQKQWHITISMTCVACADVTLILIPGSLHSLATIYPRLIFISYVASLAACVKSTMTLFIYLAFNPSFRSNFRKAFCQKKA